MNDLVTFFPDWRGDPYIEDLGAALAAEGWGFRLVGRKGLLLALLGAAVGHGTVHMHWYEGLTPKRKPIEGLLAWSFLPFFWLAGLRGRLVWTVHNVVPHDGFAPFVGIPFLRLLARSCSRILVHFDHTREQVELQYSVSGKTFVSPVASFGHAHGPPVDRAFARARISDLLADDQKLFVQIGSLRRYKQPVITVLAFRDAAPPSAMLLVAGPCPDQSIEAEVIHAAGDDPRITLRFGRLSDAELVEALCAADWSICPYSKIENPGAVNLSVAYDCPVIAPDFPAVRALTAGNPAILYPADGAPRPLLAAAMSRAATTPTGRVEHRKDQISRKDQARLTVEMYRAARS
jgi:beta-1,4-mannosyltransferase